MPAVLKVKMNPSFIPKKWRKKVGRWPNLAGQKICSIDAARKSTLCSKVMKFDLLDENEWQRRLNSLPVS
jgi:hypothetical protein